jgi:3-phenylpropionate/cinnamic acid dioxygenase small subunit
MTGANVQTELSTADIAAQLAISDLIISYAHAVDTRDWQLFRSLFTDDAVLDYSGSYGIAGGADEMTEWISGLMTYEAVPDTMHAITNVRVVLDGDTAGATAYYVNPDVLAMGADEPYLLFNAGRYDIALSRDSDGWKMSRITAKIMFSHRGELEHFVIPE